MNGSSSRVQSHSLSLSFSRFSSCRFYRDRSTNDVIGVSSEDLSKYYYVSGSVVYRWKLWGAIWSSTAGVALSFLTALVHFDTVLAPNLWPTIFRDGSLAERNWILFLMLFWAGAVHVCTSTLSVGESQANVFFTTWIAFGSTAMNYGIWRESADLSTLTLKYQRKRDTTYNWIWTGFFSCVFAGAATDMVCSCCILVFLAACFCLSCIFVIVHCFPLPVLVSTTTDRSLLLDIMEKFWLWQTETGSSSYASFGPTLRCVR